MSDVARAGMQLAQGAIRHRLAIERDRMIGMIHPYPVRLEPLYRSFDPLLTFDRATASVSPSPSCVPERLLISLLVPPALEKLDLTRAEAVLAGLPGCQGPVSFEVWADRQTVRLYLGARPAELRSVHAAWQAAYPGSILRQVDPGPDLGVVRVLQDWYAPSLYHASIRSAAGVSPWARFCQLCTLLQHNEVLLAQVLLTPAREAWKLTAQAMLMAERLLGHRAPYGQTVQPKNQDEPWFAVSVRLASSSLAIARSLEAFTGSFAAGGMPLRSRSLEEFRRVLPASAVLGMLRSRSSHTPGMLWSSSELATLVHIPDQAAAGPVVLECADPLGVPDRLRAPGIPLGNVRYAGESVPVFQPVVQPSRTTLLSGSTRMGKSTAILHRIRYLAEHTTCGIGLLDGHRSVVFDALGVLQHVAEDRIIFLDFDAPLPVCFNPFRDAPVPEYGRLAADLASGVARLFGMDGMFRTQYVLLRVFYSLFVLGKNFGFMPTLLSDSSAGKAARTRAIDGSPDPDLHRFWAVEFPALGAAAVQPILHRFSDVFMVESARRTFGMDENRVDIAAAMTNGSILLIAPPATPDLASIVGGMFFTLVQNVAFRRIGTPMANNHFHFFVDEFQKFLGSAGASANAFETAIHEGSKAGLSYTFAHQSLGQIEHAGLVKALFGIPNIVVFGCGQPDARQFAPLFNGLITPEEIANQGTGHAYARIDRSLIGYKGLPPLTPDRALATHLIAASRAKYHADIPTPPAVRSARGKRVIDTFTEE